jgi:hypothetical protein
MVTSALTMAAIDRIQQSLEKESRHPVARTADTESTALMETTFDVGGKAVPVAVTLYKEQARARIQILTHDLSEAQVRQLQDRIAGALDGRIVDRSDLSGLGLLKDPAGTNPPTDKLQDRLPRPNSPNARSESRD